MKEELLQFAWLYKAFSQANLKTDTGEHIEIIDPGQLNHDSGPDFFNAKVKINETLWVGNIEIHTYSDDWFKHKHNTNKQYNNVILHVVHLCERTTYNQKGAVVPTLEIQLSATMIDKYNNLLNQVTAIPCGNNLYKINEIYLNNWITALLYEKYETKYSLISTILNENCNDWESTFYILLCRNLGFNTNSDPFEQLAKSLPLSIVRKYQNNKFQLDALLFGQSGFLDELIAEDDFYNTLKKEYVHLAQKHNLKPLEKHQWKFMRLRPNNFPTIRIAQLSSLMNTRHALFSDIISVTNIPGLKALLNSEASAYWSDHFRFNIKIKSGSKPKRLGETAKELIILNTIAPLLFAYGKHTNTESYCNRAFEFLEKLAPENNSILNRWKTFNIEADNAFQSQSLIYLYKNYCVLKKCLSCSVGHKILTKNPE